MAPARAPWLAYVSLPQQQQPYVLRVEKGVSLSRSEVAGGGGRGPPDGRGPTLERDGVHGLGDLVLRRREEVGSLQSHADKLKRQGNFWKTLKNNET